ncbi:MAG TPA: VanZ family protein [Verrucomicrobiae bacterium]|jgi:VanZ family protein|nr:VanZ family protein [Verrucomicrobiae bacterium]
MTARRFLAPLAWSALIAWFSSDRWGAGTTSPLLEPWLRALAPWAAPEQIAALHWLARKAGHVGEYAVLALLWRRALARGGWRGPLTLTVLTAALDEAHQAITLTREGSVTDVLLDAAAAGGALAVAALGIRPSADHLARLLLWIAAAGGTVLLAIDLAAAAPSGWLWLTVPAAWLSLWAWRWRRARA